MKEGQLVKKYPLFVVALIIGLSLGVKANAQEEGKIVATIPFEFVVGGKTLPAGTYTVRRASDTDSELLISNRDGGAFVQFTVLDSAQLEDPKVSFEKVAGEYLLSRVNTPIGAFVIDTRHEESRLAKLAQSNQHGSMSSSGSN
jgi:hypothetical protein